MKFGKEWFDKYGLINLYPIEGGGNEQHQHNPHLYTGEFLFLCELLGIETAEHETNYFLYLDSCQVFSDSGQTVTGLWGRHPFPWGDPTSHDEYLGKLLVQSPSINNDIEDYYDTNHKSFNDKNPDEFELRYWRLPKDQYYYEVCFGDKPGWIQAAHFNIGIMVSLSTAKGFRNEGNKLLSWFKIKLCEEEGHKPYFADRFRKEAIRRYGDDWLLIWAQTYFKAENHPIIILIKELKGQW